MQGAESSNLVAEASDHSPGANGASTTTGGQANYQSSEAINKELPPAHSEKPSDLSLEIPPRPVDFNDSHSGKGSSRGSLSARGILRGLSFKSKASAPNEKSSLLESDLAARPATSAVPEKASLAAYIASLAWKRCVSLPVSRESNFSPSSSSSSRDKAILEQCSSQKHDINVSRSLSVPVRNIVILRSVSFPTPKRHGWMDADKDQISPAHLKDGDEEIPEEDAVCRVCLCDLCDGGSSLRLECSCKGDLTLIHEECAMKWFSIKGNRTCDVCGQEILNLPVTLIRMQSSAQGDRRQQPHIRRHTNSSLNRAWQDGVILIIISTMCYFFFLEQLLVDGMKTQAIKIAAPFAFALGFLSSAFAVILACREYVWAYAAFQFALVVIFLHLLYSMLHISAIFAILSASFAGLGLALGVNSLFLLVLARRLHLNSTQEMNTSPV